MKSPAKAGLICLFQLCWELIVFEDIAELGLLNFPSRRVWHLVDVLHIIGNPPLRNLAVEEALEFIGRNVGRLILDHDQQRSLTPLRMNSADHRSFGNPWVTRGAVFHLDRRNPLTA